MSTLTAITTQPYNLDAEKTLIGALLIDPEKMIDVVTVLTPHDFCDPTYRDIYAAIADLYHAGESVDFVTVAARLADNKKVAGIGGSGFLASLAENVPTASHAAQYAGIIREKAIRRQLIVSGQRIASLAGEETTPVDALLERAEQQLLGITRATVTDHPVSLSHAVGEWHDHFAELAEAEDSAALLGIQTGFPDLDRLLVGLDPEDVSVIAGRPGMGKTALALDIAQNAAEKHGKAVTFVSLEMNRQQLVSRLMAGLLGVSAWQLRRGDSGNADTNRMGAALDRLSSLPLHIADVRDRSMLNIRSVARRQQMLHGLDLLVIDYLQLVEAGESHRYKDNRVQEVSYISRQVKALARELNCPIIALSQLSRNVENRLDKRPILADLRESGSIEQDADHVLMLYREGYYDEDCDDPNLTDLFVRKNRQGPTGRVELRFNKERMSFETIDRLGNHGITHT